MQVAPAQFVIEETQYTIGGDESDLSRTQNTRSEMTKTTGTITTMPATPTDPYELSMIAHSPRDSHSHGRTTSGSETPTEWDEKGKGRCDDVIV